LLIFRLAENRQDSGLVKTIFLSRHFARECLRLRTAGVIARQRRQRENQQ